MPWTKPDFVEITLNMEVTAYANTDDAVRATTEPRTRTEESAPVREEPA